MNKRFNILKKWLKTELQVLNPQWITLNNDASFRRYFRTTLNGVSYIIMDAPPDKEDCQPFINIAQRLQTSGLTVPRIVAHNLEQGFLLLTDLGDQIYLSQLNTVQADTLYQDALNALLIMQTQTPVEHLPIYDYSLLHQEMRLFTDWLLDKHLQISVSTDQAIAECFELLSTQALSQPQVFVHRDYHSRNLMMMTTNNPGILDFQDAVIGPITYDLVSLLRDCYIAWPNDQIHTWLTAFYQSAQQAGQLNSISLDQFVLWFDYMGIQRHLKASGIFARLYHRDGKTGYLKDIPRTLNYIVTVSAHYPELAALHQLVAQTVLPALSEMTHSCTP